MKIECIICKRPATKDQRKRLVPIIEQVQARFTGTNEFEFACGAECADVLRKRVEHRANQELN